MADVMDEAPLEVRTIKVRRTDGKNFRISLDKHGRETHVEWPLEVSWETEEPKERWEAGRKLLVKGRRDETIPLTWGSLNSGYVQHLEGLVSGPEIEAVMTRLEAELEALKAELLPELERKREELAKKAVARLTGKGAQERRAKIVNLLASALVGSPGELTARVLHAIFKTHSGGPFISQTFLSGPVAATFHRGTLERVRSTGVSVDEVMVCIQAMHGLNLKDVIAHASSNPTHWVLLTEEDFASAVNQARVKEVLES